MRKAWVLGLLAAATISSPVRAEERFFDGYCVMGSLQVCASVRLYSEGNTLRLRVWNLDGMAGLTHTMTGIGLYHSGSPWSGQVLSYDVLYNNASITSNWTDRGAWFMGTINGVTLELKEGTGNGSTPGIIGCNNPGGSPDKWATCRSFPNDFYVEFVFNLDQHFGVANTQLRWASYQVGPNMGWVKCDTGGADNPSRPCVPVVVTPEPFTMLLLGSGLAGVGAVARKRKRREDEDGSDAPQV